MARKTNKTQGERVNYSVLSRRLLRWLTQNPGYYPAWRVVREAAPGYSLDSAKVSLRRLVAADRLVSKRVGAYQHYGLAGQEQALEARTVPQIAEEAVRAYFAANPSTQATPFQIWGNSPHYSSDAARRACYRLAEAKELERSGDGRGVFVTYRLAVKEAECA